MTSKESDQMLSRIDFAEGWLTRARRQWTAGDRTRSLLTLVLADAELRHALETADGRVHVKARRPGWAQWALVAALAVCALLFVGRWFAAPDAVATTPPVQSVHLPLLPSNPQRDDTGSSASTGHPLNAVGGALPSTLPSTASHAVAKPGPVHPPVNSAASHPAGSPAVSLPSRPSLLDLMLTAERALRQDPAGSSLP